MRYVLFFMCAFALGCTKQPGEGGRAFVTGKVETEVRVVLTNPGTVVSTYLAADEQVFILYGDHVSPDDDVRTNFDGEFEFRYLRPGKYTVYVYSDDTTGATGVDPSRMAIVKEFEITEKKEEIDLGTLRRYEKN